MYFVINLGISYVTVTHKIAIQSYNTTESLVLDNLLINNKQNNLCDDFLVCYS